MALAEQKVHFVKSSDQPSDVVNRPKDVIASRKSKELVIAFAGPIGCGIDAVKTRVSNHLTVHIIKISDYLKKCVAEGLVEVEIKGFVAGADRYIQMQDAGNADFLSKLLKHGSSSTGTEKTKKLQPKNVYEKNLLQTSDFLDKNLINLSKEKKTKRLGHQDQNEAITT